MKSISSGTHMIFRLNQPVILLAPHLSAGGFDSIEKRFLKTLIEVSIPSALDRTVNSLMFIIMQKILRSFC